MKSSASESGLKYLFTIFCWLQDLSAGDVKPFKAFHYNGLGIREEDGTKKVQIKTALNPRCKNL